MNNQKQIMGKVIEQAIEKGLCERYAVVPMKNVPMRFERQGPAMITNNGGITLPDFQIFWSEGAWVDSKFKSTSNYFYTWGRNEHGIELRHYLAYKNVRVRSKLPVYLFFAEGNTGCILAGELGDLEANGGERRGTWPDTGTSSINWDVEALKPIGKFIVADDDTAVVTIEFDFEKLDDLLDGVARRIGFQMEMF